MTNYEKISQRSSFSFHKINYAETNQRFPSSANIVNTSNKMEILISLQSSSTGLENFDTIWCIFRLFFDRMFWNENSMIKGYLLCQKKIIKSFLPKIGHRIRTKRLSLSLQPTGTKAAPTILPSLLMLSLISITLPPSWI